MHFSQQVLDFFLHLPEDLPHPRWVMQYKRKEKEAYIQHYLDIFEKVHQGKHKYTRH